MSAAKINIKRLKKNVWDAMRIYVRLRDENKCQKCGKYVEGSNCHTSHVIPQSHGNVLKYDHLNLKVLCFKCHQWWHLNPLESGEWFKKKFPERADYLEKRKEEIVKFKLEDYEQMIEDYQSLMKDLT